MKMKNLKKPLALAAIAAIGLAASAHAQSVTYTFEDLTLEGASFVKLWDVGELSGTITAVQADVVFSDSVGFTWASDLAALLIEGDDLNDDPLLTQIGGFSDFGANESQGWGEGNSSGDGTTVNTTITLDTPINAAIVSGWLGNGYASESALGTWSGSVTFIGASVAPAPGAIALLALAGITGARRRRS